MAGPDFRKGFVRLTRTNGRRIWIRVDEIAAFAENEEKGRAILSITLRPNLHYNVHLNEAQMLSLMSQAAGTNVQVTGEDQLQGPLQIQPEPAAA